MLTVLLFSLHRPDDVRSAVTRVRAAIGSRPQRRGAVSRARVRQPRGEEVGCGD